ncbi:MAG: DUF2127 domain-containing protein [Verrucomicrobia bacterium]|nr:MAG: DUF2127 domain-containing protein [Verrucomicrobiota bacterium]
MPAEAAGFVSGAGTTPAETGRRAPCSETAILDGVAVLEAAKGGLGLVVALVLLRFTPAEMEAGLQSLLEWMHQDPSAAYPRLFLRLAERVSPEAMIWVGLGALAYSFIRFAEAYGLWRNRAWAKWLGALSGGLYIPYEAWAVLRHPAWLTAGVLAVNILIVAVLAWSLWASQRAAALEPATSPGARPD